MLTNKQSLILSGVMVCGFFVFGILDILDNFVILTILTLIFFTIIINMFYIISKNEVTEAQQDDSE
ncbi:MAG: hypothetical protein ACO3VF_05380 [Tamlana sp.]